MVYKQGIKIVNLSDKDIMLGIVGCNDELFVNHVLLLAKQYLYYCRKKSSLPSIRVSDSKIKMFYQFETIMAKSNNKMSAPNIKHNNVQFCTAALRICEKKIVYNQ